MGRHRSSATAHPRRRSTLLAATGLALSAAVAPAGYALAGNATTTAPTSSTSAADDDTGSLLDIELPAICLDLQAKIDTAQDAVDNAPATNTDAQNKALTDALASAKAALAANDDCDEDTPTTTTPPVTTTPTTTAPLPAPIGGTGGTGGQGGTGGSANSGSGSQLGDGDPTTIDVDGDGDADTGSSGDGTITPSGSADTGGWGV